MDVKNLKNSSNHCGIFKLNRTPCHAPNLVSGFQSIYLHVRETRMETTVFFIRRAIICINNGNNVMEYVKPGQEMRMTY